MDVAAFCGVMLFSFDSYIFAVSGNFAHAVSLRTRQTRFEVGIQMNDMFHANEVNFFYHALFSPTRSM